MGTLDFIEVAHLFERMQAEAAVKLSLESAPVADGWMAFAGRGSYINKACGFGLERESSAEALEALVHFFSSRGGEPKVELSPFTHPSWLEGLAQRGFVLRDFENVLARRLDGEEALSVRPPRGWPEGVTVERVNPEDAAAVREYVEVAGSGFIPEGEPMPEVYLEVGLKAARVPTCDGYVARVGGEVVGAAGCDSIGGITALFGTSVKPAWRRRGIQQALIAARLERARERDSRLAAICSRPGIPTERNALRLGFAMAYSRVALVKPGEGLTPSP